MLNEKCFALNLSGLSAEKSEVELQGSHSIWAAQIRWWYEISMKSFFDFLEWQIIIEKISHFDLEMFALFQCEFDHSWVFVTWWKLNIKRFFLCHSIIKNIAVQCSQKIKRDAIFLLQIEKMKCMNIIILQKLNHAFLIVKIYNSKSNKFHLINVFVKKNLNTKKWNVIHVISNLCIIEIETQNHTEIPMTINIHNVYNSCFFFITSTNSSLILSLLEEALLNEGEHLYDKKLQHASSLLKGTYLCFKTCHDK